MSKGLTREEAYWARMSGEPIETPEPITRKDEYMQKAAEKVNAAAAELPPVTANDFGAILSVSYTGQWTSGTMKPGFYAPGNVGGIGLIGAKRLMDRKAAWIPVDYKPLPNGDEGQYLKCVGGNWHNSILDDPTFITEKVVGKMTEPPVIELDQGNSKMVFDYYQVILLQGKDAIGFPVVTGILHNIHDPSLGQWIQPSLADDKCFRSTNSQATASMSTLFTGVTHSLGPREYTKVTFTPSTFAQNSWCTTSTKMIIKGWILNDHL